jgi:hypothetical protein
MIKNSNYYLIFFRQVEFLSPIDVEIVQNNVAGEVQVLGYARAKTPANFRLPVGKNLLVFKETASNKVSDKLELYVPSLLHEPRRVRQLIPYSQDIEYESTK